MHPNENQFTNETPEYHGTDSKDTWPENCIHLVQTISAKKKSMLCILCAVASCCTLPTKKMTWENTMAKHVQPSYIPISFLDTNNPHCIRYMNSGYLNHSCRT